LPPGSATSLRRAAPPEPIIPNLAILLPFLAATLALNITPGADMAYVVARSLGQGRGAGVVSALAITAASIIHVGLSTIGLATLLAHSPVAFRLLQYAGAGYLLFIAWRLWRDGGSQAARPAPTASQGRIFAQGVLTNVLNPKVALFILAFVPQFVDPTRGSTALQMVVLGGVFCLSSTIVNVGIALLAARAGRSLAGSGRWLRRISAGVLGLLALRLAFGARS
jgi:threonine/homoserine/homoserine lactone efflux protein